MSATGSVRSGGTTELLEPELLEPELLEPELTQNSSSEESFVFNRELTSEHDRYSAQDLNPENTFVVEGDESPSANKQRTFDFETMTFNKDVEGNSTSEHGVDLGDSARAESDIGQDSTIVDAHSNGGVFLGLLSEKTEYLMSEREIADWDQRMDELVERFQKQQEEYEKWENNLNARRLVAIERLKRLKACHTRRVDLYNAVTGYIGDMNSVLESKHV